MDMIGNNIVQIVKTLRTITWVEDPWDLQDVNLYFSKTGGYCEIKVGYHLNILTVTGFGENLELALKDLMEKAEKIQWDQ